MCIILIKEHNKKFPDVETLSNCFENNPDGAGFMYVKKSEVIIKKGFMTINSLLDAIDQEEINPKSTVIYHFRQATHGKIGKSQCHPFPISKSEEDIKAVEFVTDIGFAHNGIIDIVSTSEMSDSMVFAKNLAGESIRPHLFNNDEIFELVVMASKGSKLVFLNKDFVKRTGTWIENKGLLFSNDGYKKRIDLYAFYGKNYNSIFQNDKNEGKLCTNCNEYSMFEDDKGLTCYWCEGSKYLDL